ncbi:MAG TPA: hypothetical protein VKM37_01230 [Balneolaceae bacterium]|nr:hypothetical protein [Balneolaceae bacterium]
MKSKYLLTTFLFFLIAACSGESETDLTPQLEADTPQEEFFANLFELCGETFSGEATYPDDPDHELVGVELSATIDTCTEEEIRVSFSAGEDESRNWIFTRSEEGLHLRHEHQNPDGSAQEETGYGGFANDEGSSTTQYFPADEETSEMIPEASTNVWMVEIQPETGEMVYYLERNDKPRFRAELALN